ncbi:Uncharacterized protein GBIM_15827 [Gryllus bimaculatus]|nr:Uncharacterized protein GBIM_15827 [Gryllus bimaculatus]
MKMNFGRMRLWWIISRACVPEDLCYTNFLRPVVAIRTMSTPQKNFEEELVKNPYYEKYAKKIHDLQKTSPEDFQSRVEDCQKKKAKPKFGPADERDFSSVTQPKEALRNLSKQHKTKVLSDVMKLDLIQDMSAEEISKIWETHFKDKDGISATIPVEVYKVIYQRGAKFPVFVLPLPRGQGYEFFLCQVERDEVHFTSLINYQAHKENAPECLTIVHYTELEGKGIILMRGEFNKDVINAREALCLANQFQLYYGNTDEKRLKLLERLNCNPNDFKHMDLIAELECLSLETK